MMKRQGCFDEKNCKKAKLIEPLDEDDDWGNDIDEAALGQAFDIFESSQKENTILPPSSYSSFKKPETSFTASTQVTTSVIGGSSIVNCKPIVDLEAQIKKLELQNKEKNGEILLLREKIKESKTSVQLEQKRATAEWTQKLGSAERQTNMVKSELEFKNLEIANLKQQLAELKRQFRQDVSNSQMLSQCQFIQPAPPSLSKKMVIEEAHCSKTRSDESTKLETAERYPSVKTEVILYPVYPLKSRLPSNLFQNFSKEKHIWKVDTPKMSRNTTPYLQNQGYKSDTLFKHQCVDLSKNRIKSEDFHDDFLLLMNSSIEELESLERTEALKRILTLSIIELCDLNDFLLSFDNSLKTEEIKQMDVNYLLGGFEQVTDFCAWQFDSDQYGTKAGKFLALLSELLPYNKFLRNCILSNKCSDEAFEYNNCDKWLKEFRRHKNYFLEQTLQIVTSIGKYRQASVMTEFLSSVVKLLTSITRLKDSKTIVETYFTTFFREIVCARPEAKVIYELTFFIKNAAKYHTMIEFFFKNNDKIPKEVIKKSIINYRVEGSCAFCIFHLLYQLTLLKAKNLPIVVCVNIFSFIHRTFKYFSWIHDDRSNVCICQSQLYTVAIETTFNIMERYVNSYDEYNRYDSTLEEWNKFLSHPIVVKVLNLMSFNAYDVWEKFLVVYAKFKEIQRVLKDRWQFYDAEVSTIALIPEIQENKFKEINF